MVEGEIKIFLSYKEPEYRDNLMWLRPYLDREGFELLYYGANGWTVFVPCHNNHLDRPVDRPCNKPIEEDRHPCECKE